MRAYDDGQPDGGINAECEEQYFYSHLVLPKGQDAILSRLTGGSTLAAAVPGILLQIAGKLPLRAAAAVAARLMRLFGL